MEGNLLAWSEVLEALGWCVALHLPGTPLVLSKGAREWLEPRTEEPPTMEAIAQLLGAGRPATRLVCTDRLQVWSESAATRSPTTNPPTSTSLTKREAEVLAWLREGKTGPEIVIILDCAQRTVETHIARIYRKLGVRHRTQLLFQAHPPASS